MTESKFIIKRKPNWFVLITTGIWSTGWVILLLVIFFGLITDSDKIDGELILFTSIFFCAGLFVSKIFLWHLRGQERITLYDQEVKIEKKGIILTLPRRFEYDNIELISHTERSTTPKWMKFWGFSGGDIELVYLGQTKYFGQTVPVEQAKTIIGAIEEKIKARHANQS